MSGPSDHEFVNAVRSARYNLNDAESALWGIFGFPDDDPEKQHRLDKAKNAVDNAYHALKEVLERGTTVTVYAAMRSGRDIDNYETEGHNITGDFYLRREDAHAIIAEEEAQGLEKAWMHYPEHVRQYEVARDRWNADYELKRRSTPYPYSPPREPLPGDCTDVYISEIELHL